MNMREYLTLGGILRQLTVGKSNWNVLVKKLNCWLCLYVRYFKNFGNSQIVQSSPNPWYLSPRQFSSLFNYQTKTISFVSRIPLTRKDFSFTTLKSSLTELQWNTLLVDANTWHPRYSSRKSPKSWMFLKKKKSSQSYQFQALKGHKRQEKNSNSAVYVHTMDSLENS